MATPAAEEVEEEEEESPPLRQEEEEEELECRICRGEGGALYVPCKCSGSIRHVHEDCLVRWLEHSGSDRCELCGFVFRFDPVYAEDAPERVSLPTLITAGLRFGIAKATPFAARFVLSCFLWLVATPLATCLLYRAWVHSVPTEMPAVWSLKRVAEEVGSGLAIVAAIVVSFLCLLSFTDYMRVRWELLEMDQLDDDHHEQRFQENDLFPRGNNNNQRRQRPAGQPEENVRVQHNFENDEDDVELHIALDELLGIRGPVINVARNVSWLVVFNAAYLGIFAFVPFAVGSIVASATKKIDNVTRLIASIRETFEPTTDQFFLNIFQKVTRGGLFLVESGLSMIFFQENNVTDDKSPPPTLRLDDLVKMGLGYVALGLVACAWRAALKSAPSWLRRRAPPRALRRAEKALDAAAAAAKVAALLALKMVLLPSVLGAGLDLALSQRHLFHVETAKAYWHSRVVFPIDRTTIDEVKVFEEEEEPSSFSSWLKLDVVLPDISLYDNTSSSVEETCAAADPSSSSSIAIASPTTMSKEEEHLPPKKEEDESLTKSAPGIAAAVRKLGGGWLGVAVSRWVLGITFMLVVTVAVLQLREVLHPQILAKAVRPHEPRPDLLATLLAEPAKAHAKRLFTSLAIYGVLLAFAVAAPAALASAVVSSAPAFLAKFAYVAPKIQIPIELVVFHLALLALLERLKAKLRDGQRIWLQFACKVLDLDNYLLPQLDDDNNTNIGDDDSDAGDGPEDAANADDDDIRRRERRENRQRRRLDELRTLRWAWGDEEPGTLEQNLKERVKPETFLTLRLCLLAVASWLATIVATLVVTLGPILLGRGLLDIFRLPTTHDPFNLATGWAALLFIFAPLLEADLDDPPIVLNHPEEEQAPAEHNEAAAPVMRGGENDIWQRLERRWRRREVTNEEDTEETSSRTTSSVLRSFLCFCVLWYVVAPLSLGILYDATFAAKREDWAQWSFGRGLPPLDWRRDSLLGLVVLHGLALSGARVAEEDKLQNDRRPPEHNQREEPLAPEDERQQDSACQWWALAALSYRETLVKLVVERRPLKEAFDPSLIVTLASPVVIDILEIFMTPALPTATALVAGRLCAFGPAAPIGAQALVLYRYAFVATFLAIGSLYLAEPIRGW